MTERPKQIGIAIVEHDGRYLIGTRGPDVPLTGFAEFPGGKCLPGETPQACAVRECLEETQLAVVVERLLLRREFTYPHGTVDLHFFLSHPAADATVPDQPDQLNGFRWIDARDLASLKLPEANAPVIQILMESGQSK